jgi:hypothetical protein
MAKVAELEHINIYQNANVSSLLLSFMGCLDSIEVECGKLWSLILAQHMDNFMLASNNNGTQSSIHGGEVEEETRYLVPMEVEDEANQ